MLVGALCRLIKEPANRELLLSAPTPETFLAAIITLENKILGPVK